MRKLDRHRKGFALVVWLLAIAVGGSALLLLWLNQVNPVKRDWGVPGVAAILGWSYATVGLLIVRRQPQHAVGWLVLTGGLAFVVSEFSYEYATFAARTRAGLLPGGVFAAWLGHWLWMPTAGAFTVFLPLLFPTGHLPSPRWMAVTWLGLIGIGSATFLLAFTPGPVGQSIIVENPLALPLLTRWEDIGWVISTGFYFLAAFGALLALAYRFRYSGGVVRQQMKWLLMAAAINLIGISVSDHPNTLVQAFSLGVAASIPAAIGIAILKYRLYDIDIIIRRTLVYGALTGVLGLLYLGSVVLLQGVFRALTGQGTQLAVVASTLTIAALFNPLRGRVQRFIDRRFYRRRYDAQQVLAAFGASLRERDNADLERLTGELLGVIQETVQPAHLSLWLRDGSRDASGGSFLSSQEVKRA